MWRTSAVALASLSLLPSVLGTDILKTSGFSNCNNGSSTVKVNNVDISFDRSTNNIDFDVSGTSSEQQFVTAELIVTAYGINVYNNSFDPCADDTKVDQLCPGTSSSRTCQCTLLTSPSTRRSVCRQRLSSHPLVIRFPDSLDSILSARPRWRRSDDLED